MNTYTFLCTLPNRTVLTKVFLETSSICEENANGIYIKLYIDIRYIMENEIVARTIFSVYENFLVEVIYRLHVSTGMNLFCLRDVR